MICFIILSVLSSVLDNALNNYAGKRFSDKDSVVKSFQQLAFGACFLICFVLACFEKASLYSILLGVLFGIMTFVGRRFWILAMAEGPMHITILVTTASMLIPTLSGVLFFGEDFSAFKLIAVVFLIVFLYLASATKSGGGVNGKWFLFCGLSFLGTGLVGVLQKVHQSSPHSGEFYSFLASAFLISVMITFLLNRPRNGEKEKMPSRMYWFALVSGICVFAMYAINTKLSGVLPSQLFFPLINGSNVIFSSVVAVVIFKERLSAKQIVGMIGGMLSLVAICTLP